MSVDAVPVPNELHTTASPAALVPAHVHAYVSAGWLVAW